MALSNWATLAFKTGDVDHDATATLEGHGSYAAEFYKNWLYVSDDRVSPDEGYFTTKTVSEVTSGFMRFGDLSVYAERGPQNGVYAVIKSGYKTHSEMSHEELAEDRGEDPEDVDHKPLRAMIGCSVYGYRGSEWEGVTERAVRSLKTTVENAQSAHSASGMGEMRVSISDFALSDVDVADLSESAQNQGNMFFEDELGIEIDTDEPVL
jgi:hypothetical protein